jgi:hypothetical protein
VALDGTYSGLLASIADWLNKSSLTAQIPDFVVLAEARLRRELKNWLRTTVVASNITADYAVPGTVQDVVGVSYNDGAAGAHNFPVDLISDTDYQTWMERNAGAATPPGQLCFPELDVVAGTTILRFWPPATVTGPIANLKIKVAGYLPALSNSNPTNGLLRDAADVYLYGALAESSLYLQHDERLAVWEARLSAGVKALRVSTERRLYGGAPRRREFARTFG